MSTPLGGRGDDDYNNDVRWEEQDMPYLSRDRRRAEWGEGDVDDGVDDEHVDGRVRGPHRADTGDGRRWRSRRDSDNDDDVEEGGSHPTPLTTVTCELAARLHSVGIPYASEVSLSDVDDVNGRRRRLAMDHPMMMKRGVMSANYGLMPPFFFAIKLKTLIEMSVWCLCAFISVVMAVLSSFRHHHGLYALRTADFELITH